MKQESMRRTALAVLLLPCLLFAQASSAPAAADAGKRPNILFLYGDDWAWPHASCLGTPGIQTPTFDRLAREGVLFRNAHCAAPSCSPSRAAVLTGQWPWRLEQGANLRGFLAAKFDTYPDLLEKTGYFVGLTGKGYGPGDIGDRKRNAAGPSYKSFEAFLAARPAGKPFCFWLGSHKPHRAYVWQSGRKRGIDLAKLFVPPYLPDNETVRDDIADYYAASADFDREAGVAIAALEKTGELDNTLIVMSGDNGWPMPRSKATLYDSGTHQPLAIRWGGKVKGGRTVEDFTSLADLAPTFLDAAGLSVPAAMTARSLLPVLLSDKSPQACPERDHVLTGMETHAAARPLHDGRWAAYPMRSIVTKDFHLIRNFLPDRWPAGDPAAEGVPAVEKLTKNTFAAYADVDASPTKAWMLWHRDEPAVKPLADRAFGKRPAVELYDLRKDPYELKNVADDAAYTDTLKQLETRLTDELKATGDPRVLGGGEAFDGYNETAKNRPGGKKKQ